MKNIFLALLSFLLAACAAQKTPAPLQRIEDLQYPFTIKKQALSNDITVAYADEGAGATTLLFIHGLGSYLPAWKHNVENLRDRYRCIAIDLPGYGKSSKGSYEGSMTYYAKIIEEFSEKLGLQKVVLVGHSMGGQISMATTLAYPERVEKLVLVSPAGLETFNKGQREWFRQVLTPDAVRLTTVEQIRTNLATNFYNLPADATFMIDDRIAMRSATDFPAYCYVVSQNVRGMVDEPVFDFLPQIQQPALVIYGENDNLIPNRYLNGGRTEDFMRKGAERMPNAEVLGVKNAGHFVQFEKAGEVNAAIRTFLQ